MPRTREGVIKQPNGVEEHLTPNNRALAEKYYSDAGLGPTAEERYEHFKTDPVLSRSCYYNINYDPETEEDVSRLSVLEWFAWQWDGAC